MDIFLGGVGTILCDTVIVDAEHEFVRTSRILQHKDEP